MSAAPRWLLLLCALYLCLSLPELAHRFSEIRHYHSLAAAGRMDLRTLGRGPLLRELHERVPEDAAVLLDVPQKMTHLWADQLLNYWLYPRPVYSAHALRRQGEDVDAFVRERRVGWVVRGSRLVERPGARPRVRTRDGLPEAMRIDRPWRAGCGMAAALAAFVAVGGLLLWRTRLSAELARSERIALAFLLGVGALGLWAVALAALGLGPDLPTLLLALPVAALPGALRRAPSRERRAAPPHAPGSRADRLALAGAGLLLGLLLLRGVALPMAFTDSRYQWAHKAHVLLHEQSLWGPGFQDPHTLHFHPKYPLLVPGAETVFFLLAGGFNDQLATPLFASLVIAFAAILRAALVALGASAGVGVAVLAFAALPYLWGHGRGFALDGGAGFTGYADGPLAVFVAAGTIYLVRGLRAERAGLLGVSALLFGFAALSKAEGGLHLLVYLGLLAVLWLRDPRVRALRGAAVTVGLVCAGVLVYELAVVARTAPGYLPDDDYARLLGWQRFAEQAGRLPAVFAGLVGRFALAPRFGAIGALLAGALCWRLRSGAPRGSWLPMAYALALLAVFALPYALLAEDMWRRIFDWSAGRLVFQLTPLAFFGFGWLALAPRDGATDRPSG